MKKKLEVMNEVLSHMKDLGEIIHDHPGNITDVLAASLSLVTEIIYDYPENTLYVLAALLSLVRGIVKMSPKEKEERLREFIMDSLTKDFGDEVAQPQIH